MVNGMINDAFEKNCRAVDSLKKNTTPTTIPRIPTRIRLVLTIFLFLKQINQFDFIHTLYTLIFSQLKFHKLRNLKIKCIL